MTRRRKIFSTVGAAARQVVTSANGLSLGLVREPRKLLDYVGETGFLYRSYTGQRGVPQRTVFEVLGGRHDIVTASIRLAWVAPDARQWFRPVASYATDLMSLCALCALTKPKLVFEIGTLSGYTALHFALNTEAAALIYTLDLPPQEAPLLATTLMDEGHIRRHSGVQRYVFESFPEGQKVRTLLGDSARFDFSEFKGQVDLFFIDGAHSYEYVRQDTLSALQCSHPGSVIAWHDYGRTGVNGVSRWVDEFACGREIYAVPGGSVAFTVLPTRGAA